MEGWHKYSRETYVHVNIQDLPDYAVLLLLSLKLPPKNLIRLGAFPVLGRVWIQAPEMSDAPKQERVGGSE